MPGGDASHDAECFTLILALRLSHTLSKCSCAFTASNLLFFSLILHLFRSLSGTAGPPPAHSQASMSVQKGQEKAEGKKKKCKKEEKTKTRTKRQLQWFQENAVWGHVIEAQCLLLTRRSSSLLHFRAAVTLSLDYSFLKKPSPSLYTQHNAEEKRLEGSFALTRNSKFFFFFFVRVLLMNEYRHRGVGELKCTYGTPSLVWRMRERWLASGFVRADV